MKATVVILLALIGVVWGEMCSTTDANNHCGHVVCGTGEVPMCQTGLCTCGAHPEDQCAQLRDCGHYFSAHPCKHSSRHCLDQKCVCSHIHGGGDD